MLLMALGRLGLADKDADVASAMARGDVQEALRLGLGRLERAGSGDAKDLDPLRQATLGQVLSQALLAAGREEQAEELMQRQLRHYEALPRARMRQWSSMDRGYLFLHMNKPGRAAESFNVVADAEDAPLRLRIEALAGLAKAMLAMGEHRRGTRTLAFASRLAESPDVAPGTRPLLAAIGLELQVCRALRHFDDIAGVEPANETALRESLRSCEQALRDVPAVVARLDFLAALMASSDSTHASAGVEALFDGVRWYRERRMAPMEERARVDAALALLDRGQASTASEILGPLAVDDARQLHHRHAIELRYCASRLHAMNGRHPDALRCYRQHAQLSLARLRFELTRVPYSRFLEQQERADQADADQLRLPPRYRRAYQFILDHLHDRTLSVRRIAAEIDVTERALQMAFRSHLGLTPAELLRKLRMACIRTELQQMAGRDSVLAVATRWGMANRSTLAHNYRQQFGEAPSATASPLAAGDRASVAVAVALATSAAGAAAGAAEPPLAIVLGAGAEHARREIAADGA
ncbi:AraC-type DNA-binding protein [Roseateles sp. YR242]|uniref:helix-turn-helix transcriptional regulator n=1 Tax=Roseateles sp. YR242 TaxID=1855305 RepID=UPI0008B93530|nr:helix-turn-helix transcriptional regulator [Roseateles sp. YR242]SEK24491.1 AraC-type DNA-binding protein [Roseateles sp. YR242]